MPAKIEDPEQALLFVLRHPLRRRLLRLYLEAGEGLSPKELADYTKEPLSNVAFHVRALRDQGAVVLVDEQPRRGAVEHFYKATRLVEGVAWGRVALGLSPQP
jgi:DNA-binding transcriptional ArsR family regulator